MMSLNPVHAVGNVPTANASAHSLSAARRLRGASVLLAAEERRALNPNLPTADRQRAVDAARSHLAAAWLAVTTLSVQGSDPALAARASRYLGTVNRRLPIIEAGIRGPVTFTHEEGLAMVDASTAVLATVLTVAFYGEQIQVIRQGDDAWLPFRPLCDRFALDFSGQLAKAKATAWAVMEKISTTGSDGKTYAMMCLNLRSLAGWLFSISPNRVRPELREGLIRYQREAADALYRFLFTNEPTTAAHATPAPVVDASDERLVRIERQVSALASMVETLTRTVASAGGTLLNAGKPAQIETPATAAQVETHATRAASDKRTPTNLFKTYAPHADRFFKECTVRVTGEEKPTRAGHLADAFEAWLTTQGVATAPRWVTYSLFRSRAQRVEHPQGVLYMVRLVTPTTAAPAAEAEFQAPAPTPPTPDGRLAIEHEADAVWEATKGRQGVWLSPGAVLTMHPAIGSKERARVVLDLLCTRGRVRRESGDAYRIVPRLALVKTQPEPTTARPHQTRRPPAPVASTSANIAAGMVDAEHIKAWITDACRDPDEQELALPLRQRGTLGDDLYSNLCQWMSARRLPLCTRVIFGFVLTRILDKRVDHRRSRRARYLLWLADATDGQEVRHG